MLQGPIDPACPASLLRRHPDAHVLLDRAAAAELASA
jgi:6-phosphogluconolactonase/glucosamine-6-phosphate isomerase/deaminase